MVSPRAAGGKADDDETVPQLDDKSTEANNLQPLPSTGVKTLSRAPSKSSLVRISSFASIKKQNSVSSSIRSLEGSPDRAFFQRDRFATHYGPRSALTNTPLSQLGGFHERFVWKPPVETFENLRTEGTCKKVVVAKVPLKKSQITNYFD